MYMAPAPGAQSSSPIISELDFKWAVLTGNGNREKYQITAIKTTKKMPSATV
jgi:hypothetical protein